MNEVRLYRSALMCPLCHCEHDVEGSLRAHLAGDHSTTDLVDFVVAAVDAEEAGPLAGVGH
ncbi:hypothetical protein [Halomarina litorea]|uniref:hypothetical protein n=1 Tax=Halomarina litorea TaxID=2961595 RepID=UPI0020C50564|nr:hypothetical protein [Halomarina sp. BCD28]